MGQRRLIRHNNKIIHRQRIEFPAVSPGMIIQFAYREPDVFDKFPLLLVLQRETIRGGAGGLLNGLNLNYLYDTRIRFLKTLLSKVAPISESKRASGGKKFKKPYNKFGLSSTYRGVNSSKNVFKKIIGPRIIKTDDCYRSYKEGKMKNLQVCYYNFD